MGTASSGGSGGGSGLRFGGGGGGGYYSSGGEINSTPYDSATIREEVGRLFKDLFNRASTYMQEMLTRQYTNDIYSELFILSSMLHGQDPIQAIGNKYGIDMDAPQFIFALLDKQRQKYQTEGVDSRCVDAVRLALENLLFIAVKEEPYLSIDANGKEVVAEMRKNVEFWKSVSGYFMLCLFTTIYKKDVERKTPGATLAARAEIERRTNGMIASYVHLSGGQRTDYRNLLKYIGQNWDWFKEEMTQ